MIVVVMGVMGAGKTTLGRALATALDADFVDADDHHPPSNVAKLARGEPLDDADRAPWLAALAAELRARATRGDSVVLACSALKASYREALRISPEPRFVWLRGSERLLAARLAARGEHFADPALLRSQRETLEPPEPDEAVAIDVEAEPAVLVARIVEALRGGPA